MNKKIWMLVGALAFAGCEGNAKDKNPTSELRVDVERYRIPLRGDDFALGGEEPLVTIVVFSDYACGPCRGLWDTMRRISEDYGDDVRIVHRGITVAGFAPGDAAAEAVYAAGEQGKFWPMHWRLFEHQDDLSRPMLRAHAEALGLDVEKFEAALDDGRFVGRRLQDRREATRLGVIAAPIAFVNGMALVGPKPDEAMWHQLVDAEIELARKTLAEGVKRPELYANLQHGALERPLPVPDEVRKLREDIDAKQGTKPEFDYTKQKHVDPDTRYDIPLANGVRLGSDDAPIKLVEFVDFQCPFCRKEHTETLAKMRDQFGDELQLIVLNLPLEMHPEARGAAKAALAAERQGRYWEFHDRLFENGTLGYPTYLEWAADLGLDVDRFKADYADPSIEKRISEDHRLSYQLGISGTPAFFLNGRPLSGFRSISSLTADLDAEREKVAAAEAEGIARAAYYEQKAMAEAVGPNEFPNATVPTSGTPPTSPEPQPASPPSEEAAASTGAPNDAGGQR